ncbi:addiction module killer protein [Chroococcidiopsis sp. CCALA 051]|uniref:type II toxin-antitoxin system RelE/ParE family toxin n=1 Tax=Chroococcidiopsis sp. CCALA 051 TaxID=869949 RepID=UPI000D0D805B|nr:type II toxin-antitoxin system RelE/ParE family toxin [Chroococcidiopsis sp. CCALA 051]MBE9019128.1 type II toxin-antitoxin system RelE/ParE family toxin [Chroococcidiopsidales cyanobacterium LEGE 13417]PSM50797.1 addiction module killer protein [Chroococcidiopsis sp. CCALA 051]
MPEASPREIQVYATPDGKYPFIEWLESLRDSNARAKIKARLDRVETGNLGDYKAVGKGVCELKIDYGSGYRVYFGQVGTTLILLLCGGDKSTQEKDIPQAIQYWTDYGNR